MPKMTIDGNEIDVPDAVAAHLAKSTERLTALEAQAKAAAEEAGRIKAAAEADAKAKDEAKLKAEMEAAAKKGELDKVMELARTREQKFAGSSLANAVRQAIAGHAEVKKTGLDDAARARITEDLAALVAPGLTFDLDTATIKDANGQAVDLAARIAQAVAARPWFAEAKLPSGTRAGDSSKGDAGGNLKRSAMTVEQKTDFITKHGQAAFLALPA